MARLYRTQARVFDVTRVPVLLGRTRLPGPLRPGTKVLEVGCGTGRNLRRLAAAVGPDGRVVGVECAPTMAARARRIAGPGIVVIEAEYGVGEAPLCHSPFDAIVFSYSLSMIPDFERVLEQAHRDLTPGGRLIILDFADSRWPFMRRWMGRFGVELGDTRRALAASRFEPLDVVHRRAWGGLWEYYLLVAERR